MTFQENIVILRSHIDDLEAQLKRLEEKKVKSSGSKARALLLKIKTLSHEMRKDVLTSVKDIPTKKKVTVVASSEPAAEPAPEPAAEEPAAEEPPVKKARGRPKKPLIK